MGNQQSVSTESCSSCRKPFYYKEESQQIRLFYPGSTRVAYCSDSCQTECWKTHWERMMRSTDRDLFNKLLTHIAEIRFKYKLNSKRRQINCIVSEENGICLLCAEVAKWNMLGAEQNDLVCQHTLGYCYSIGMGILQSDVEAAKWFGKAVAGGHTDSIVYLNKVFERLTHIYDSVSETSSSEASVTEDPS